MKKRILINLLLFIFLFTHLNTTAQVAINSDGSTPAPSSILDVHSTEKGILIPRLTATQRDNIASPAQGLLVYVTDDNNFYYYNGSQWVNTATQPDLDWQINGNNMYAIPSGNVGIGTTNPRTKLTVIDNTISSGDPSSFISNYGTDGVGLLVAGDNPSSIYTYNVGAGLVSTGVDRAIVGITEKDDSDAIAIEGRYIGSGRYDATGVEGYSNPQSYWGYGVKGTGGYVGVYGEAQYGFAGLYGSDNNTSDYAIFGDGDLYVTGNLGSGGGKTFMIDHPLDPKNKILKHFALESDEVLNVYRGNVILNKKGKAKIKLPSYFKAININYSYTLTPIGVPAPGLYIEKEIDQKGNFVIAGGKPGQKISWYVYAERDDMYMRKYPEKKKAELNKKGQMKGKYLQPEVYGKTKKEGVDYKPANKTKNKKSYIRVVTK